MNVTDLIGCCLAKKGVEETTPFGPEVLVYKVCGKVFALTDPDDYPPFVNLKCDPDRAQVLRDQYESIKPGYHMNKKHWNSVYLDSSLPEGLIRELVDHSYELVVKGLSGADRKSLDA